MHLYGAMTLYQNIQWKTVTLEIRDITRAVFGFCGLSE